MRVKGTNTTRARRKKMIKLAKGYRGQRHINYKVAKQQVWKSWFYAFRDRKTTKRNFRKLWIARINAAARMNGLSYSRFMNGLALMGSTLNRKMLADLAISDASAFASLAEAAKKALADNGQIVHEITPATTEKEIKINVVEKAVKVASSEKPTDKNTVAEIKAYLSENNIEFAASAKKADLLALV
ncbi:50S ribosomal protein L2 [Weissella oryzae SG25]|uniref:Large ribosomal subunit protein bL20 n=1 Tax=Weissella oryzae (strain DSM 25784 / JCM 18191 / LMG 30913 / SG25) TaxID=1329250 RepID=A0A069CVH0_WEIOS|nr:50S ribosomal protein L2 [Weissella oryzae SG25]